MSRVHEKKEYVSKKGKGKNEEKVEEKMGESGKKRRPEKETSLV